MAKNFDCMKLRLHEIVCQRISTLRDYLRNLQDTQELEERIGFFGYTPLHEAVSQGNFTAVRMLLLYGANPNSVANGGYRPLHIAASMDDVTCVAELLSSGANIHSRDEFGKTPYQTAFLNNSYKTLELLEREYPALKIGEGKSLQRRKGSRRKGPPEHRPRMSIPHPVVPAEIRARGPEACTAFQEALADGKTKERRVPVMVVGPARAGKTSTIRSLKGEDFNPCEDSTVGIRLDRSPCELRKERWVKGLETATEGGFSYEREMGKTIARKLIGKKDKPQENSQVPTAKGGQGNLVMDEYVVIEDKPEESERKAPVQVPEDIAAVTQLLLQETKQDTDTDCIYSLVWDFAGQPTYMSTHPVFLSPRPIYLLVHNLSTNLHAQAESVVKSGEHERVDKCNNCRLTNMDSLALWMSSICQISTEQCSYEYHDHEANVNSNIMSSSLTEACSSNSEACSGVVGSENVAGHASLEGKSSDEETMSQNVTAAGTIYVDGGTQSKDAAIEKGDAPKGMPPRVSDTESRATSHEDVGLSQQFSALSLGATSQSDPSEQEEQQLAKNAGKPLKKFPPNKKRFPPVFLVCTHKDEAQTADDAKRQGREILKTLTGNPPGHHLVHDIYTVDNKLSGQGTEDADIARLREDIHDVAQNMPHIHESIPIRWLQFEKAVASLVKEGYRCIKLPQAQELAKDVCQIGSEEELRHLLNYLHDLKVIIHFEDTTELNRLVILDPQWLADMFARIITVQPIECQDLDFEEDWGKLENDGLLTHALIQHVWGDVIGDKETIETLMSIMQKFSLLCKWDQQDGSEVFLVPCMLMNQANDEVQDLVSSPTLLPLVVKFSSGFLPLGFFPRFLVFLVQWCAQKWPCNGQPNFFSNFARFYIGARGNYSLIVTCDLSTVVVTVRQETPPSVRTDPLKSTHRDKHQPVPQLEDTIETICQDVMVFLKNNLDKMRREFPWMRNMQTNLCIRCPVCLQTKQSSACKSHKVKGCTRDTCMHYFAEDELRKGAVMKCLRCPTARQPIINKDMYDPWLGEEKDGCHMGRHDNALCLTGNGEGESCGGMMVPRTMDVRVIRDADATDFAKGLSQYLEIDRKDLLSPPPTVVEKIRHFCGMIKTDKYGKRLDIVEQIRKELPNGVTGPLLPEEGLVKQLPFDVKGKLTMNLSGGNGWRKLSSYLKLSADEEKYLDHRMENPAECILDTHCSDMTIGRLYDILAACELEATADKL